MAEGHAGQYPQVFVVDSQASYTPLPSRRHFRWGGIGPRALQLLVGLALVGIVMEVGFIVHLYNRTGALINAQSFIQRSGSAQGLTGSEETNEILVKPTRRKLPPEIQRKPSAHLIGSSLLVGEDSVVQWESDKGLSAFTDQMDYKDGRLVAQRKGHYYVYSKVHFVEDCFLFKHKVMRITEGYKNKPLVLMKANRFHCPSQDSRPKKISHQNLLNSYLGGVFRLLPGDIIYVTVDNRTLLRLGAEDNFMGAFMI
ncbi:tumor necrosis factor ligand superfamily member 14 [Oncorhynchus tshawytscha]|uniref:tumor necrosis factor ligand superfamily member 14 n=1 Tax=Oncorhynchus tshawytscha TaxID=74940 RepID=UPI001C3CBCDE|nr:tumor necrosis factor ligand superfamily member 14 [Oncorhynchus tshawytscha]XP_042169024.1 tumor necrosis factor ligand superfamily member 14 [Oncorhynchus tshawytscha]XP_042169025.1 tumor necrosis factor ligand superfamily member 14 [Oncorhynchus tshawytscha]